ncbi:MAG: T9SS type A sorting domain-containing protein [Saprospiraceae bacterium]|nr:T9SS type A sorting domain-containing protein [Saprospiraceae bacterium]
MKAYYTFLCLFLLISNARIAAQGSSPCSPYSLSVGTSYAPSSYSLMGVLINFIPLPSCDRSIMSTSGTLEPGLWLKFVVPTSGIVSLKTENVSVANSDIGLAIFRATAGSCPSTLNLSQVICIANGNGYMPAQDNINLSSYIGQTLYIRVWKFGSGYSYGSFKIGLWSPCQTVNIPMINGINNSCSGSVTLNISNVQSGVTYQWSHNNQSGTSTTVNTTTSVTVRATNSCGNTATSQPFSVTINSTPDEPVIDGNPTSCEGAVTLSVSNVHGGVNYTWSNGSTGTTTQYNSSTTATVRASNTCGNILSKPVSVTIFPPLAPTISGALLACNSTTLRVSNPQTGATYSWSNGQTGTTLNVSESGSYTVTAERQGCNAVSSNTADVTINKIPDVPIISGTTNAVCPNDVLQIGIDNPCTDCQYAWSNGSTGQNISVNASSNLSLTVTVRNSCGQTTSQPYKPTLIAKPPVPIITGANRICPNGGQVTLSVSNYDPNLTYAWTNSGQGASITITDPGNYTVNALHPTCSFGSLNSSVFVVSAYPTAKPIVSADPRNPNALLVTNASLFQTFQWYKDGQRTSSTDNRFLLTGKGGSVYVEATDANGCVEKSSSTFVVATNETKIDEDHMRVYPNPTDGDFTIDINTTQRRTVSLKIFDVLGRVVYQIKPQDINGHRVLTIPFYDQIQGNYWVQLAFDEKIVTRQLVLIK